MAKVSYKIPARLDRSYLDHEISLTKGGVIPPAPIKQLFFFCGGLLLIVWLAQGTFIAQSGPVFIVLFVIWGLATVAYLGSVTKTKELRAMSLPALISYLPKTSRYVATRRNSNPTGFYSIARIDGIDDDGLITFTDGSVGQLYLAVGSASFLLFDEDRSAILDRVDAFWRKVDTTCQWTWITTKEPQRIHHQVAHLEQRNHDLEIRDPDLVELLHEQYAILRDHVGGKFVSIHQYLMLTSATENGLHRGHTVFQAEAEGSGQMIKEAAPLDRRETETVLSVFYRGIDT